MLMKILLVTCFTLSFLHSHASKVNPCRMNIEPPYTDAAMFLEQSCYFAVINGSSKPITEEWMPFMGNKYIFNTTVAREVCAAHGATLPVINSDHENNFVANYNSKEFVNEDGDKAVFKLILGLQKNEDNIFTWDDGTKVTYESSHGWVSKKSTDKTCVMLKRNHQAVWISIPCMAVGIGTLGVLCKKIINPDCQYKVEENAIGPCLRDDKLPMCYEMANLRVLAPALEGGKACPESTVIRRHCQCPEARNEKDKSYHEDKRQKDGPHKCVEADETGGSGSAVNLCKRNQLQDDGSTMESKQEGNASSARKAGLGWTMAMILIALYNLFPAILCNFFYQ